MKRRSRNTTSQSTPLAVPVLLLVLLAALLTFAIKKNEPFIMQAQTVTGTPSPSGFSTPKPVTGTPRPTSSPTPRLSYYPTPQPTLVPYNLLKNGSFETDANGDGKPDNWSTNSHATRSRDTMNQGSYSIKHAGTDNTSYTVTQSVNSVVAGKRYTFRGWVNIPATSDSFTFTLQVRWRNSENNAIRTDTVRSFTGATAGWNFSSAYGLQAPSGTVNAQIIQRVSSLNAKIYADNFSFTLSQ